MEFDFKCNTARLAFDLEQWALAAQLADILTQEEDSNPDVIHSHNPFSSPRHSFLFSNTMKRNKQWYVRW
jgi:hypothetical protein